MAYYVSIVVGEFEHMTKPCPEFTGTYSHTTSPSPLLLSLPLLLPLLPSLATLCIPSFLCLLFHR